MDVFIAFSRRFQGSPGPARPGVNYLRRRPRHPARPPRNINESVAGAGKDSDSALMLPTLPDSNGSRTQSLHVPLIDWPSNADRPLIPPVSGRQCPVTLGIPAPVGPTPPWLGGS